MLIKLNVKTRNSKEYLSNYLNPEKVLKQPKIFKKKHNPYFPNILCKFYLKNNCSKGDECIFSHDASQFTTEKQEQDTAEKTTTFSSPFL